MCTLDKGRLLIIMAYTEEQKAYHLRKMRTHMSRLDYNLDGYISREDYELMSKKFVEYSELNEDQVEQTVHKFLKIADVLGLKPGVKIPVEEAAQQASQVLLSRTSEQRKAVVQDSLNLLFNVLDTKNSGCISVDEYKVYFHVITPELSELEIAHSFNSIDVDKNGEITREEFLSAAEDFFSGIEKTEVSEVFFGQLL